MQQPLPLGTRVYVLERDRDDHATRLGLHEGRIDRAESRLDVFGTKLGIYAAIGGTVGGLIASALAVAVVHVAFG